MQGQLLDNRALWVATAKWGSFMHAGDPGQCMYAFNERSGFVSRKHAQQVIDWCETHCMPDAQDIRDRQELADIVATARAYLSGFSAEPMTASEAFEAIIARINGVWDNPALLKFGPLATDPMEDIVGIARSGLDYIASEKQSRKERGEPKKGLERFGDISVYFVAIIACARGDQENDALDRFAPLGDDTTQNIFGIAHMGMSVAVLERFI